MEIDYSLGKIVHHEAHEALHWYTVTLCDEASRSVSDLVAGGYM
jgi:hypothetical protein